MNILLVDDDPFIRTLLLGQLSAAGCNVTAENNVDDAMKMLQERSFDLLITDIVMPNKDGSQLMQKARLLRPDMPILAITGGVANAQEDYAHFANLYADATLIKPIKKDELIATVRKLAG